MEDLGRRKVLLLDEAARMHRREAAMQTLKKYAQSSDPRVLIKQLSASASGFARCARKKLTYDPVDPTTCTMYEESVHYYHGRLNEIATHMPDQDTGPWLARLTKLELDTNKWRTQLGDQLSTTNNEIEKCRSEHVTDETAAENPCTTSIVGTWNWWNGGYTVTFNADHSATHSAGSAGEWSHQGGNRYRVHWDKMNTDDNFTLSSDGTKLIGNYAGTQGVSTRKC